MDRYHKERNCSLCGAVSIKVTGNYQGIMLCPKCKKKVNKIR